MLSGGKAGLVPLDILRKEQEENRRRDRNNQPLEGWLIFPLLRYSSFTVRTHRIFYLISDIRYLWSVVIS